MAIHKIKIEVTVLCEADTLADAAARFDTMPLNTIAYQIEEGDCIGVTRRVAHETIPPDRVQAELEDVGNDGTFFEKESDDVEA